MDRRGDFKPGNTKVVHHILAAYDVTGNARKIDAADPGIGLCDLGRRIRPAPQRPALLPGRPALGLGARPHARGRRRATAAALPAGADVLLQIHYHKSGKPETDATAIGLYFARGPWTSRSDPRVVLPAAPAFFSRPELRIPAGRCEPRGHGKPDRSARTPTCSAVFPHMHWLGKDFLLRAVRPTARQPTLIRIDDWDFNWQDPYDSRARRAAEGDAGRDDGPLRQLRRQPRNPSNPPVEVHWGEQTTDEMCIGFLQLTRDDEHLGNRSPDAGRSAARPAPRPPLSEE